MREELQDPQTVLAGFVPSIEGDAGQGIAAPAHEQLRKCTGHICDELLNFDTQRISGLCLARLLWLHSVSCSTLISLHTYTYNCQRWGQTAPLAI